MKITKLNFKILQSIKPAAKRYNIQVENSKGLFLVVGVNGNINFTYRYQLDGRRRDMSLGSFPSKTLAELNKAYASAAADVANGIDPLVKRERERENNETDPTIKELVARYMENHVAAKLKPKTMKEYQRQFDKYILPKIGRRKAKEISRGKLVAMIEKMVKENGPYMANRNLALLKGLFTYAVRVGVLKYSPAAGITPPGKETAKDRVLSLDEIKKLIMVLGNAPRDARDIFLLILLTGQRPGEVSAMRLHQVKGDWWELSSKENKSGRPHRVYLASWARQIIQNRINDLAPTDYLFTANGNKRDHVQADNLKTWLHRRLGQEIKEAGIDYFTAHDLRRSAATGMAILGHAAVIGDILNHAPQGITRTVYDKYDREPEIKRALISWETAIKEALAGGGRKVVEVNF